MGMVLSFVPRTAPVNRVNHAADTAAAVIIFPGSSAASLSLLGRAIPGKVCSVFRPELQQMLIVLQLAGALLEEA
ncbi:MAG: hypothetical protein E5V89_32415 [Mesorhizobium sp.]|nr:MAG: hypothetical protein E5V89_32415 [Mesorhizobium sp.]